MYKVSINGDCTEFRFVSLNYALRYVKTIAKSNNINSVCITQIQDDYKMPEIEEMKDMVENL